ncbi:MAG: ArsR family transcriptional regulator [Nocardioides sp.]
MARSILENGLSTAADLATRLELTPAAVRRHLDHLLDNGLVEAHEQRVVGHRGRGGRRRLRADRGGSRPVRPAVRRPGRPGAPLPGRDRRARRRRGVRPPAGGLHRATTPAWRPRTRA